MFIKRTATQDTHKKKTRREWIKWIIYVLLFKEHFIYLFEKIKEKNTCELDGAHAKKTIIPNNQEKKIEWREENGINLVFKNVFFFFWKKVAVMVA